MTTAQNILVIFLSAALAIFLTLAIILIAKLIGITKEAKKIVITGQKVAENVEDASENIKDMTSVGGIVKVLTEKYIKNNKKK